MTDARGRRTTGTTRLAAGWRGGGLLMMVLLAASGCSGPTVRLEASVRPSSPGAVLLPVPVEAQREGADCGLACLSALLRHHGLALDDRARAAFPVGVDGVRAGDIRDYLTSRGLRAHLVRGTLDDAWPAGLLRVLRTGLPVLVALSTPDRERSHYVLVAGFDPQERQVLLMDPAVGAVSVPYDRFEPLWARADHLMLVVAPGRVAAPGS